MRYADPDHTTIVTDDGLLVPVADGNLDYARIVAMNIAIAPYMPPPPSGDDVRREADRRMRALLGARDAAHLDVLISNGTREAVRLLRKGAATWTPEEAQRAAVLEAVDQAIEAIRAASNALEANPPADYAADRHWPG